MFALTRSVNVNLKDTTKECAEINNKRKEGKRSEEEQKEENKESKDRRKEGRRIQKKESRTGLE
jgi:hypothetical protein